MGTRRNFFEKMGLTFIGGLIGFPYGAHSAEASKQVIKNKNKEVSKKMDVLKGEEIAQNAAKEEYELVVVGGGISGVSAAISAARCGMKVALVHNRAMFGGNSSSEVRLFPENTPAKHPWIKEGGINEEFHTEERVRNHKHYLEGTMNAHWDLVLYEWVIREKNITHFLNTHMHQVFMKNDSMIESIFAIQLGTEKSFNISAPFFVDATGDGVLGKLSGADFRWGREAKTEYDESLAPKKADEIVMGNTLFFRAEKTNKNIPFKRPYWVKRFPSDKNLKNRNHSFIEGGYWWVEVGTPFHPIKDNNETRHEALRQSLGVWDHIKNQKCDMVSKKKASKYGLDFMGFWPYKRASRRIIGDYVVTQDDVQNPERLSDAIAYGVWDIDVHVPGGILSDQKEPYAVPGRSENWQDLCSMVYDIPIRSLYSKKVSNLLMAGRPISCSYLGFSSARVLTTGSICGQAVGVITSLAKKYNTTPRGVYKSHASEAQQIILRNDGYIPGVDNEDPNDLARKAEIIASSQDKLKFPVSNGLRELKFPYAQMFPVTSNQIKRVSLLLKSKSDKNSTIRLGLRKAPFVWNFQTENDIKVVHAKIPAKYDGWVDFDFNVRVVPDKLYYIYTEKQPGIFWRSFKDSQGKPSKIPIGTTAAYLPDKTNYSEKSETFKSLFPDIYLKDIPGAGKHGHWKPLTGGRSLCLKLTPNSLPYGAINIIKGTNRPDKWTNIWISNHEKKFPAHIQLRWGSPLEFNKIQLTFDTDQNKREILPLFRYPNCVKNYKIEYYENGVWKQLIEEKDNYVRRRVHHFNRIKSSRIRVNILATNGGDTARIYEIRVYNE